MSSFADSLRSSLALAFLLLSLLRLSPPNSHLAFVLTVVFMFLLLFLMCSFCAHQLHVYAPGLTEFILLNNLRSFLATQASLQFVPWGEATESHAEMPCIVSVIGLEGAEFDQQTVHLQS
jgi:uncharacterized integral membrane protein